MNNYDNHMIYDNGSDCNSPYHNIALCSRCNDTTDDTIDPDELDELLQGFKWHLDELPEMNLIQLFWHRAIKNSKSYYHKLMVAEIIYSGIKDKAKEQRTEEETEYYTNYLKL